MSATAPLQKLAAKSHPPGTSGRAGLLTQRKCACASPTASLTGECAECKGKKRFQAKLSLGASNDPLELEADRIAEQVLAGPVRSDGAAASLHIQRFTGHAAEMSEAAPASVDRVLAGSGRPLDQMLQQDMEQRFGHDFSRVRIHSDAAAMESAREVGADAYTVGHDIAFAEGRYAPGAVEGRRLLAHELVHVVQQMQAGGAAPSLVAAPLLQKKDGYPKTVTIENAEVRITSKQEEDEAKKIIAGIKLRFGITFDAQKGLQALKKTVVPDADEPATAVEFLMNPSAPKKKVKDLLETSVWTVAQLRDLQTGLTYFSPVLGLRSLDPATQQLTSVSRLKVGLDDARKAPNKNLYGQFFSSENHAAFYDSAGSAIELADKSKAFLGIVVHEVAHAMLGSNKSLFISGLSPAFWKDDKTPTNDPKAEQPITPYGGQKNASEDLAEAVMFYFIEPATLQNTCRQRYAIVDKLVQRWRPKGPSAGP